jgi:hypothetical protein
MEPCRAVSKYKLLNGKKALEVEARPGRSLSKKYSRLLDSCTFVCVCVGPGKNTLRTLFVLVRTL